MAEVLLEIKNLRKVFEDDAEVLKDFNLSVEKGEVVSIIGPSGSGKTTALRCHHAHSHKRRQHYLHR